MTDEYYTAVTQFDLSLDEVVVLYLNILKYSFVEAERKSFLLGDYASIIFQCEQKYNDKLWRTTLAKKNTIKSSYTLSNFGINFVCDDNSRRCNERPIPTV